MIVRSPDLVHQFLPTGSQPPFLIIPRKYHLHHDQLGKKPLRAYRTIIQLIAATTTETGLKVQAELNDKRHPKGLRAVDDQLTGQYSTMTSMESGTTLSRQSASFQNDNYFHQSASFQS